MIRVYIVDDVAVQQQVLKFIVESDSELKVIGIGNNGKEAVEFVAVNKPDIVLMDIHMPVMDGFEATREIMKNSPVPVLIVSSSSNDKELDKTFRAIESGALTFMEKPPAPNHPEYKTESRKLIQNIKALSKVDVSKRIPRKPSQVKRQQNEISEVNPVQINNHVRIIAIGASTGGPPAIQKLLAELPEEIGVPVVIVQHISPGFLKGMTDWLSQITGHKVVVARDNEKIEPNVVYFAPEQKHLTIKSGGIVKLNDDPPEHCVKPAVSQAFRSIAKVYGKYSISVLLTGMGADGATELKELHNKGSVTFAQDKESSVVHGMPGEAIKMDAAKYIMSPEQIGYKIKTILQSQKEKVLN